MAALMSFLPFYGRCRNSTRFEPPNRRPWTLLDTERAIWLSEQGLPWSVITRTTGPTLEMWVEMVKAGCL